jgi:rubrerythrin
MVSLKSILEKASGMSVEMTRSLGTDTYTLRFYDPKRKDWRCSYCGADVSVEVQNCPHCGSSRKRS